MIVKVPKPGITDYELKYFMEADTPARKNMRKITLADSGKAAVNGVEQDDDDVGRDDDDLPEDDDTEDTPETDDDSDVDDVNLDDDDLDIDDEDLGDDEDDDEGTADDTDGATDDEETGDDTDAEDSAGGTDGDGGDEGGNDDVAVDNEGDGTGDDNADEGDNPDDGGDDNKAKTPEQKQELIQKFNLFTKMKNLHETTGKYIEKINMLIAYNTDNTTAYQAVCDKLDEMRGYIYEYMLVKFDGAKYVESMLFYHRATTLIYLILEELDAIKIKGDEKNGSKSSKRSTKKTETRGKSK